MWTSIARAQLARPVEPYATCLTDAEWAIAQAFLPLPSPRGRPRRWAMRLLLDTVSPADLHDSHGGIALLPHRRRAPEREGQVQLVRRVPPNKAAGLRLLLGIQEPAMSWLGPTRAGLQSGRALLGKARSEIKHLGLGQPNLHRDGGIGHAGLAQTDHPPPAFLLRGRRQLAHVHLLHARDPGPAYSASRSRRKDQ